ncbi:uncharacterized protein LOC128234584 isoform X2 [Mya arenaria]|uniref:uncharacterized protein LOC128234584 isoform X2 n=1 Tax=Mya arenaria TaxID=6604 RepID=UPI0022E52E04|nr:uncharacterized protein LOC128234584 isoform X2 [Mya arenaria]
MALFTMIHYNDGGNPIITKMIFLLACACKSMTLWILVYVSRCCEGLGTPAITVKNDVGVLSLLQPTFVGRNVTFEFTPSAPTSIGDVRWNYIKQNGSKEKAIEEDDMRVQHKGNSTYFTIPDVDRSFNGTSVYTSIDKNRMSALLELNLKVFTHANNCGELYFLTEGPNYAGDNLSLGYFPSPQVAKMKNTSKYSVKLINGSNDDHTSIQQAEGVLELDQVGQEIIFTLFNVKKNDSGSYWVQCLNGVSRKYSNAVHVSIEGMPIIGPLTTLPTCRECIVFKTDQTLGQVYCKTDEEYNATNVKFEIGLFQYESIKLSRKEFVLKSYEKPADSFHQLNAICTVFGIHRNISVKASIFVVVNPNGPPYLSAKEVILEGETVNITCTSSSARPPPLLRFLVNATEIDTNTNASTTLDDSTALYTSVSTLHSFKRDWGNKNMYCQQHPEVNGLYHESLSNNVYILYKYPPSRLIIVIQQDNLSEVITATCTSMFADPACNVKWESTIKHFKYTVIKNHTFKEATESIISFSATYEDYGKQIRCSTECQYFKNALENATTVIFAKKPTVDVYSTPVLPVPSNTIITLTCVANAHPFGNITWTMVKATNSKSSQTKTCSNASTCTYEMTTSDVEQVYSCYAKNEHGSDEGSIVIGDKRGYKEDQTGSDSGILGNGLITAGGIAFLFIVIVVMCLCLRLNKAKRQLINEDNTIQLAPLRPPPLVERDDVTHEHTGDAEYAGILGTRRNLENVALPSSLSMPSCDAMDESFENAATESTVHLEQPSNENGISVETTGPDVRRCQSKEHLYTTDKENGNGISMQNQEMNPDAPHAESQKRSTNELVYADVDIEHLEKFRVRILACNDDESTEYSDIVFGAPCSVKPDSSNENV